jgi:hypothetical protein
VQVLTWLVLPFFQVYADAGDFTIGGRCMTSLKENGLLYGLAGAAGMDCECAPSSLSCFWQTLFALRGKQTII